jgi:hypothetical protein
MSTYLLMVFRSNGVVVAAAVIETLASLDLAYPKVDEGKLKELGAAEKKLLSK